MTIREQAARYAEYLANSDRETWGVVDPPEDYRADALINPCYYAVSSLYKGAYTDDEFMRSTWAETALLIREGYRPGTS